MLLVIIMENNVITSNFVSNFVVYFKLLTIHNITFVVNPFDNFLLHYIMYSAA